MAPPSTAAKSSATTVVTGISALRRTWRVEHAAPAQPFGPGQANVVGVEGLNHGRALVDGPRRVGDQDQRQRRQRGVAGIVGQSAEEGAAQGRALLAVGVEDGAAHVLVDGDGHELLEGEAEHEDRRGQQHEVRHCDHVVGQLVLPDGRPHAETDRDDDGENGGDDHHAQRDEEVRPELRGDGLPLGGVAEVAVEGVGEPDPVALPQRVVQVEQVLAGDDRRMRGVRVGPQERERVAGGAHQKEDQDRREEEDDDADQETPNDVGEHGGSLGVGPETLREGPTSCGPAPPSRLSDPLGADVTSLRRSR